MNANCDWFEAQLEAYFTDGLDPDSRLRVEAHAASCAACGAELAGYQQVDMLVAAHFRQRVARARIASRPASHPAPGLLRLAGALTAVAIVVAGTWMALGGFEPGGTEVTGSENAVAVDTLAAEADKSAEEADAELAKPDGLAEPAATLDRVPAMAGSPDPETRLYLQDAAGYFHTLDDFTGSILVLGVLGDDPAGTAAFSETYSRYGADATLRFLGVPTSTPVGADTPFPTMRNRDSTLMETRPGEFSIVSPSGIILARGDLEVSALDQAVAAAAGHTAP